MPFLSADSEQTRPAWFHRAEVTAALLVLCPALSLCQPQPRSILCRDGNANFDAEFRTGVKVHVGAAREAGAATLATRACAAKLSWEKQELLVATGASQLDLDVFGADFGDAIPVAAFQIKKSDAECCTEYRIYSLEKPPRLLRTITGGEFFTASDVDLDGSVEIWTNDARAVDGFETLTLAELDSAPAVILRLAHGRLLDVSAEFQSYFDGEIAQTRSAVHPQDLVDFKKSDGKLADKLTPASAERIHRLRSVKTKVLEIVWNYLYSGRDEDAWRSLAEQWPAADIDRIRAALLKARAQGIRSQTDVSSAAPTRKKKSTRIFDAVSRSVAGHTLEVVPPRPILIEFPPTPGIQHSVPDHELFLDLVIDAAGKVRSAAPADAKWTDADLIESAMTWKFIPAFKEDRAVACRLRIAVSPKK